MAIRIPHVRIPDEVKYPLNSIANAFPKLATLTSDGGISLKGLTDEQSLSLSVFRLLADVDEVVDNLNMTIDDVDHLSKDHRHFGDTNPVTRYKLLVRTFFYEYSRFQDLFERFTSWQVKHGMFTKKQRRNLLDDFYKKLELAILLRNVLLHGSYSWAGHISPEIVILESAEHFGLEVKKKTGEKLSWADHLAPLCVHLASSFIALGKEMQVFWSMTAAEAVYALVKDGKLRKAKRPFRPKRARLSARHTGPSAPRV